MTALDLATGERVALRIDPAGVRADQQALVEACTRAHAESRLVDFGFIGKDRRFEATARGPHTSGVCPTPSPAHVMDWLECSTAGSSRLLALTSLPDAREIRLRGFVPLSLAWMSDAAGSAVLSLIEGRSIILLDDSPLTSRLALALLKLRRAKAGDVCALPGDPWRPAWHSRTPLKAARHTR